MARRKAQKTKLPGSIYARNGRYWWKVQLPGEDGLAARPLKPAGSRYATTDYSIAVEVARNLLQDAIYRQQTLKPGETAETIAALTHTYLAHVDQYYTGPNGKPSKEAYDIRRSLIPLTECFAALPIEEFGPLCLMEVREYMVTRMKWSRNLINQRIGRIKRMFKWATAHQLAPVMIYHGLMAVEGLKFGRTAARETEAVKPIEERYVSAVLPYMTPVVAAMVEIQLLTGMRPGEVCLMRPCDLDRSGSVWHYYPERHKNKYRGKERIVSIGPRGQELIRPYLLRPAEQYCFSPAESDRQRREELSRRRETPQSCGNTVGSNRKANPKRKPGEIYDSAAYGRAVKYSIDAANRMIKRKAKEKGIEKPELIPHWTPYQLRHTAATKVRREMGYETAGATLGHTNMSATAIYAERNQGLADEAARRFG